ncbi:MAG: PLD nuclease N-terminal domain-containing protein [Methylacidiphilales bacterium]|nr:PLD nuclease N-terminal domain-containing protein [Candidatus Methylacidiphilales bacterium]
MVSELPLALLPSFLESPRGLEVIGLLFWIWVIYECARREPNGTEKVLWLILVVCAPVIGSLIYFLLRIVKVRG